MLTPSIIKTEKRKRLYHDRFQYALTFILDDLYMIRELPGAENLQYWIDQRLKRSSGVYDTSLTPERVANLHAVQDRLLALKQPFKFMVSYNQGYVYTSSYEELQSLYSFFVNSATADWRVNTVREAMVTGSPNIIALKNPKYSSRIYFKDRQVSDNLRIQIAAWLANNTEFVNASDGLNSWLYKMSGHWRSNYLQRYFYIDCKDNAYHTLFAMTFPGILRCTMPIVAK